MNNNSPKLAANSYFFKELLAGDTQNASQAFGPVMGNEGTQYRLTSGFTATADTRAFSICAGQVFLQPHSDTAKVNLILRPYRQPVTGVPIKYFIYRGLKKVDFIPTGNTFLVGYAQLGTATEFMQLIWNQLKTFNNWTDTQANNNNFRAEWIGYKPADQPADSLIDDYFFAADAYGDENNETLKPFEFPLVPQGTFLGNFTGDYGLDIVLSNGDYKEGRSLTGFALDLAYARAAEAILDTANVPTGYAEKQYRETIGQFMDAAAYYGLHYSKTGTVTLRNGTNTEKREQQSLYDDIISQFATKNTVYLHIKGHLGRSYNYYNSYGALIDSTEVLQQGTTIDNIVVTPYPANNWPVILQEAVQTTMESTNSIFLRLVQNAGETLVAHAQIGQLSDAAENNFLTESQLRPSPGTDDNGNTIVDNYCNPMELLVPAIGDINNRSNVASYIKVLYTGNTLTAAQDVDGTAVEQPIKPIDTLFGPVDAEQRLASASGEVISWVVDNSQKMVDISEVSPNESSYLTMETRIIADKLAFSDGENVQIQNRIVYEAQMIEGVGEGLLNRSSTFTQSSGSGSIPFSMDENNFYQIEQPFFYAPSIINDLGNSITVLNAESENNLKFYQFVLGITTEENNLLQTLVSDNSIVNPRIYLEVYYTIEPENNFRQTYTKHRLGIIGENASGNLQLITPSQDIFIYSLDRYIYTSAAYSSRMELSLNAAEQIIPNFNL